MLVSFKHKYIFIHCRKAAGTSVDAYLAQDLGEEDILIGSWCAAKQNGANFNKRFKRELLSWEGLKIISETLPKRVKSKRFGLCGLLNDSYKNLYKPYFSSDPTFPLAKELKSFVGDEFWDSAVKFTIIRNTYERTVSDWIWRMKVKNAQHVSFHEFLLRLYDQHRPDPEGIVPYPYKNFELYTINNKSVVDFTGHVSTLHDDLFEIFNNIGIEFNTNNFPHAKKSSAKVNYKDFYGQSELRLINKIYGEEIEFHRFKFE